MFLVLLASCHPDAAAPPLEGGQFGDEAGNVHDPWFTGWGEVRVWRGPDALAGADPIHLASPDVMGCGTALAAARIDGDDTLDLVVLCGDDQWLVWSGSSLLSGVPTEGPRPMGARNVESAPTNLGDLDGDGDDELGTWDTSLPKWLGVNVTSGAALAAGGDPWHLDWSLRGATGTYPAPHVPASAGDVDADGIPDVAIVGSTGSRDPTARSTIGHVVSGLRFVGAEPGATIGGQQLATIDAPQSLGDPWRLGAAGDLDGDGLGDLALATSDLSAVRPAQLQIKYGARLTGPVEDGVALVGTIADQGATALWTPVADLDADGRGELAITIGTGAGSEESVLEVALVPGADLPPSGRVDLAPYLLGIIDDGYGQAIPTTCDLDGDGLPELITFERVWLGSGLLAHEDPLPLEFGRAVCLGDLDQDGTEELAVGDPSGGEAVLDIP